MEYFSCFQLSWRTPLHLKPLHPTRYDICRQSPTVSFPYIWIPTGYPIPSRIPYSESLGVLTISTSVRDDRKPSLEQDEELKPKTRYQYHSPHTIPTSSSLVIGQERRAKFTHNHSFFLHTIIIPRPFLCILMILSVLISAGSLEFGTVNQIIVLDSSHASRVGWYGRWLFFVSLPSTCWSDRGSEEDFNRDLCILPLSEATCIRVQVQRVLYQRCQTIFIALNIHSHAYILR